MTLAGDLERMAVAGAGRPGAPELVDDVVLDPFGERRQAERHIIRIAVVEGAESVGTKTVGPHPQLRQQQRALGERRTAETRWDIFVEELSDLDDDARTRLTGAGKLALAAEDGGCAPIPLGLILGDTHLGGTRPPLNPDAVIATLQALLTHPDLTDGELIARLGPPSFPTGCTVDGNLDDLYAGRPGTFDLRARVTHLRRKAPTVRIDRLPPDVSAQDVLLALRDTMTRPSGSDPTDYPVRDISDLSRSGHGEIECTARDDATMDQLVSFVTTIDITRVTRLLRYRADTGAAPELGRGRDQPRHPNQSRSARRGHRNLNTTPDRSQCAAQRNLIGMTSTC